MDSALFEAIAHACLVARSDEELRRDLPAYLRARGVSEEDVRAILESPSPPRFGTYRMLVRNNLSSIVFKMLGRTRARLGALFDETFDAFLVEAAPRTHYLRDVPQEFLAFALERWSASPSAVEPYLLDLARHELVDFAASTMPGRSPERTPGELALDRPLVLDPTTRLVQYAHAVHELPAGLEDRTTAPRRDVRLLVYRDSEHIVRYLELTSLAAAILRRLVEHREPLGAALANACAEEGVAMDDSVLASTARLLADLAERGVVLGSLA